MSPPAGTPFDLRMEPLLLEAARRLRGSRRTAALTGAGLSVESGIPPFRRGTSDSPGLWERYDPMEYGTIDAFVRDPARVWVMLRELSVTLQGARPNAGHTALAGLEAAGLLAGIITQNVDGLHQEAGSRKVIELHGNWRTMSCLVCGHRLASRTVPLTRLPPLCRCGGALKPDVTLFGEIIPADRIEAAWEEARSCECLLVVGTSAEVAPASGLPRAARDAGAFILEINVAATPLSDTLVDLRLEGSAGVILPRLAALAGVGPEH